MLEMDVMLTSDHVLVVQHDDTVDRSTNGTGAADTVTNANTGTTDKVVYAKVIYYSGGTGSTSGKYTLNFTW